MRSIISRDVQRRDEGKRAAILNVRSGNNSGTVLTSKHAISAVGAELVNYLYSLQWLMRKD